MMKKRWKIVERFLHGFFIFWLFVGYVLGYLTLHVVGLSTGVFLIIVYRKNALLLIFLLAIGFGLGHFRYRINEGKINETRENAQNLITEAKTLQVKIIGEPSKVEGGYEYLSKIQPIKDKEFGYLEFETVRYPEFKHGDLLKLEGYFRKPRNSEDIDFDYVDYLEKKEIFITGRVNSASKSGESADLKDKFLRETYSIKNFFTVKINRALPEPHASLLAGILFGVRSSLPEKFSEDLRITGTTHIVAISGYNMTIIIEFVKKNGKKFLGKFSDFVAGLFVLWFGIMTGMSPPVFRAVVSAIQALIVRKLGMKLETASSIINTAFLMLLVDPKLIYSISFMLSFAALLGLIYWVPILKTELKFIPGAFEEGTIVTLAASIATFPISMFFFGTFSLLAIPTNFLVAPFIGIIMSLGFMAIFASMFDFILPILSNLFYLSWVPLDIFTRIVEFMANFKLLYLEFNLESGYMKYLLLAAILVVQFLIVFSTYPINKEQLPRYL